MSKSFSNNEKQDLDEINGEPKVTEEHRSSVITDDPEEVMDLRERLYEQNITGPESELSSERAPLIGNNESQSEFYVNAEGTTSSREGNIETDVKQVTDEEPNSSQELTGTTQNDSNVSKTSRKKKKKNKKNSKKNKKK